MSFWTGLEAFTGHRPGAFTGMTMKDLFDNDMWKRLPKTWSGKMGTEAYLEANPTEQMFSRGGEPLYTKWFDRNAGGQEEVISRHRQDVPPPAPYPSMRANYPAMPAQAQTRALAPRPNLNQTPLSPFIPGVSSNQGLNSIRQWGTQNPNVPGSMALDPTWAGGLRGAGLNAKTTTPPMLDKTTVVTESENPNEFNTTKTTYKQQVPANPTNTLMNMGQKFISGWQGLARKRLEDEMRARQNYNHPLREFY